MTNLITPTYWVDSSADAPRFTINYSRLASWSPVNNYVQTILYGTQEARTSQKASTPQNSRIASIVAQMQDTSWEYPTVTQDELLTLQQHFGGTWILQGDAIRIRLEKPSAPGEKVAVEGRQITILQKEKTNRTPSGVCVVRIPNTEGMNEVYVDTDPAARIIQKGIVPNQKGEFSVGVFLENIFTPALPIPSSPKHSTLSQHGIFISCFEGNTQKGDILVWIWKEDDINPISTVAIDMGQGHYLLIDNQMPLLLVNADQIHPLAKAQTGSKTVEYRRLRGAEYYLGETLWKDIQTYVTKAQNLENSHTRDGTLIKVLPSMDVVMANMICEAVRSFGIPVVQVSPYDILTSDAIVEANNADTIPMLVFVNIVPSGNQYTVTFKVQRNTLAQSMPSNKRLQDLFAQSTNLFARNGSIKAKSKDTVSTVSITDLTPGDTFCIFNHDTKTAGLAGMVLPDGTIITINSKNKVHTLPPSAPVFTIVYRFLRSEELPTTKAPKEKSKGKAKNK